MRKSFPVLCATAVCVIKFWSDQCLESPALPSQFSLLQPVKLVDLTKGISHETDANHDPDSANRRKRIGTALRSAVSIGKYARWRKKGTVQHVEHESYHADRSENSTATSR